MTTGTRSRWLLAAALACFAAAGGQALTQAKAPPPAPANLQVLPKDMERAHLIGLMKDFTIALGVKCTHCHVGADGKMDFASDAKKEKEIARAMLLMVLALNRDTFKVTDMKQAKVTCFTCHQGGLKPAIAPLPKAENPPAS